MRLLRLLRRGMHLLPRMMDLPHGRMRLASTLRRMCARRGRLLRDTVRLSCKSRVLVLWTCRGPYLLHLPFVWIARLDRLSH